MRHSDKEVVVQKLVERLSSNRCVILTNFIGLDVEAMNQLRRKLRQEAIAYQVVKNTLARRAVQEVGCEQLLDYLDGPTALAFVQDEPSTAIKIMTTFAEAAGLPKFKVCLFDGNLLNPAQLKRLARLPTREVLLAKVVGELQLPLVRLSGVLTGMLRRLVVVLDAIVEEKRKKA